MALDPNNKLLNYDFETYRVSLKKLESITKEINCELFDWNNLNSTANFSQIKAFGIHNNIILDDFYPSIVYFISRNLMIYKLTLHENIFDINEAEIVFKSSTTIESTKMPTPAVLFLPSSSIACFFDGINTLSIISTNNRCKPGSGDSNGQWKLLCSTTINALNCDVTLLECRVERVESERNDTDLSLSGEILHCCFLKIFDTSFDKNVELMWTKYKYCHQSGQLSVLEDKVWRGATSPEMVTFSSDFKYLEIVGDHSFRYIPSDMTINTLSCDNVKLLASWWQESKDFISVQYYLNMATDDFTINILFPDEDRDDLTIQLIIKDREPLELYRQKLGCSIERDLSKWSVQNEILVVELKKLESSEPESVEAKKSKVTFEQYEEVDNCDDTDMALVSFDGSTGSCMEEIGISRNEWLFKTRLGPNCPMSACIRYNVDGLIWCKGLSVTPWIHRHTLSAFGYVSAAKVDRKFTVCSLPDREENGISFVVMSDWKRSICVFMQCKELDTDMSVKNRATGRIVSNTADEFFVSLDKCQEIMGLVANKTVVFVLYRTTEGLTRLTAVNCA